MLVEADGDGFSTIKLDERVSSTYRSDPAGRSESAHRPRGLSESVSEHLCDARRNTRNGLRASAPPMYV